MNETFTNVAGADAVVDRVVECWASLWSPRVVAYRATRGLDDEPAIAVVVQRMVDSHTAGVMFTADPATGNRDHLVIEAAYGLGEVVVGGQVEPDSYVLAKDGRVLHQHLGTKATRIVRGGDGRDQRVEVPAEDQARRALDDRALATLDAWRERSSGTTARPRTSSSPSTTSASGSSSPGPSPRWADTTAEGPGRAGGHRAGVRARRRPGRGRRTCAHLALSPGGRPARPRRGAGGTDDDPRLGAHHAPGGGPRDRRRRCHLPRRHRGPGAGPADRGRTRTATSVLRDGGDRHRRRHRGRGAARGRPPATGRNGAPTPQRRRRWRRPQSRPPRCSTSTWPSPSTQRRWPRCPWTASACCAPSS